MAIVLKPTTVTTVDPTDVLTPREVADRLKVKPSWVYEQTRVRSKVRNKGKKPLPCHPLGRLLRFHWPEVAAWWLENKD
jgi:hypothetical protein